MEYITLIGIVIIVVGFAFKLDVLATVIISGIVTGLVSGMNIIEILEILGSSFVSNRLMSIFLIIFPVIAIIERYGLKERAAYLIGKIKNASAGKVLAIYSIVRTIASALNIRIGGVVQFVRPLIMPMAQAAGEKVKGKELTEDEEESLKGLSSAVENYGNFFAQNCFMGSSGTLLIVSTLNEIFKSHNIAQEVTANQIALNSIPIAIISVIVGIGYALWYDRKLKKRFSKKQGGEK